MADAADLLKNEGNALLKNGHLDEAVAKYDEAIKLDDSNAIYYCNRAQANLQLENYGLAQQDAATALKLNPKYAKAYHRHGCAQLGLGKYNLAVSDFKNVCKLEPKNRAAREKYQEVQKIAKRIAFEKAIEFEHKSAFSDLDLEGMKVHDDYDGPHLTMPPTEQFAKDLLEHFKKEKKLDKKYMFELLVAVKDILSKEPNMNEITIPDDCEITVCGDVHGQYYDLLHIFETNGLPSETNPYLFNGDFVDRGSFSVEIMLTLFLFKVMYPKHFWLNRGNHETRSMNVMYGFDGELTAKYSASVIDYFKETFWHLPLCSLLNKRTFVTHGGLFSKDGVLLNEINKIDRVREPPDSGIMSDLLWSDPLPDGMLGRQPSKRGVSCMFGQDVTEAFMKLNNVELVIRSHEMKMEGYEQHHGGKLITIFSAPNYCDQMGNKGAFIKLKGSAISTPKFTQFVAQPHPAKPPMAYSMGGGGRGMFGL